MKMKIISLMALIFLTACNALPQLYQTAEDIANDDAIDITISREALNKGTDLNITIDVINSQVK